MDSLMPVRKVTAAAISGCIVTIVVFSLNTYVPLFNDKPIPGEVSSAATTLLSFVVSYLTPAEGKESK